MPGLVRRIALATAALVIVGIPLGARPAAAADPVIIPLNWTVSGETTVAKPHVTAAIPEGARFTGELDFWASTMVGDIVIPDMTVKTKLFGLIPVTAVVRTVPTARTTGTVDYTAGTATATSRFKLQIVRLSADALPSVNLVPKGCITARESVLELKNTTPLDLNSMSMAGTYEISPFTRCGLSTTLISSQMSGPGNTMNLTFRTAA